MNKSLLFFFVGWLSTFVIADDDKLIFVQAVWRHGDRSPTTTFPNDPYQEDSWPQGWGQLSPLGMKQHLNLGEKLHKKYIDDYKLLTANYQNHEVYIRSTDVNRTLISAMSNMVTMFPAKKGDYPNDPRWPTSWVPIPIHTVNDDLDYTLNADMECPRQSQLWEMVKKGPEYTKMQQDKKDLFDYLTNYTGMAVTPENLWIVVDAIFIENSNNYNLSDTPWDEPWKDNMTLFEYMNVTNDEVEYWNNGLHLKPQNGIDFSIEIPKIRGGTLLWSMIGHMEQKLYCLDKDDLNKHPECTFFKDLKYYAYSAHDTTIVALFSALGFHKTNWNSDGYPHYSAAVTAELWLDSKNKPYVKFIYFPLDEPIVEVTESVTNCSSPCYLDQLAERSKPYLPSPNPSKLCNTLSTTSSAVKLTSFSLLSLICSFILIIKHIN